MKFILENIFHPPYRFKYGNSKVLHDIVYNGESKIIDDSSEKDTQLLFDHVTTMTDKGSEMGLNKQICSIEPASKVGHCHKELEMELLSSKTQGFNLLV